MNAFTPLPKLQRARGEGRLTAIAHGDTTRIGTLFQEGCAKIRLPHTHDKSLQAVLINTAGGLTGGDDVGWTVEATPESRVVLTTQACERVYRSLGDDAKVRNRLTVGAGAQVDWLPQETILFEGGKLDRTLEVDLAEGASFCAVEAILLGREAMGEAARTATLRDNWRIRRNGKLVHAEATLLSADPLERDSLSLLDGALAFATVLLIGPKAERKLEPVRAMLHGRAGASLIGDRLIVRAIAESGLALRKIIGPIIAELSGAGTLPRLWHL